MGRLAAVPPAAFAVLAALAWCGHEPVEQARMQAVLAHGHVGPVAVAPLRGEECWRAREGFAWRSAEAAGQACAGPGDEVRLWPETR